MSTPNVVVTVTDFLTGRAPANLVGYKVDLAHSTLAYNREGYTNSSGVVTFSSVTPGTYTLKIFGLGIPDRTITVTNVAGPLDASDLDEGASVSSAVPGQDNPLIAGSGITLTDTAQGLEIAASGGGGGSGTGFTDTSGALSVESDVEDGADVVAFSFDTSNALTSGNVAQWSNGGVLSAFLDYQNGFNVQGEDAYIMAATGSDFAQLNAAGDCQLTRQLVIYGPGVSQFAKIKPSEPDGAAPVVFDTTVSHTSGNLNEWLNNGALKAKIDFAGKATVLSVATGAPTDGTSGTWKLGVKVDATTTLDTTKYVEVDIGGTLYKLALVTSS